MAWLTGWNHRKKITTQFANCDSALTDFPGRVPFSADADLADALATGYDIRFTQSDGTTLLSYQREKWSGGGGANVTAEFWVKFPSWSAVAGTEYYMYWEKAGAADGQDAANAWNSDYKAVWHLSEASGTLYDSTANNHDTTSNTGVAYGATGKVDDCMEWNASSDRLVVADHADFEGTTGSMSALIYPDSYGSGTAYGRIISHRGTGAGFEWWVDDDHNGMSLLTAASGGLHDSNSNILTLGSWQHVAVTWDGSNVRFYVNGVARGAPAQGGNVGANTEDLKIGNRRDHVRGFDGKIDELRYTHNVARPVAWLKLEYHNIFEADNELTWGSKESAGAQGDAAQTLSAMTQAAAGQVIVQGDAVQTLSPMTQAAAGQVLVQGDAAQTLSPMTQAAAGQVLVQGDAAQTLGAMTQAAVGDLITLGPYRVAAGGIWHTGAVAGQRSLSGVVAGDVFHAGAVAGQRSLSGVVAGDVFHTGKAAGQVSA